MPPNIVPGWPPQRGQRIDQGLFHTYSIGPAAGGPGGGTPGIGNPQMVDPQQRKMLIPPGGGVGGGGGPGLGGGGGLLGGELSGGMGGPVFGGLGQATGAMLPGIGLAQGGGFGAGEATLASQKRFDISNAGIGLVGLPMGEAPVAFFQPNSGPVVARRDIVDGGADPSPPTRPIKVVPSPLVVGLPTTDDTRTALTTTVYFMVVPVPPCENGYQVIQRKRSVLFYPKESDGSRPEPRVFPGSGEEVVDWTVTAWESMIPGVSGPSGILWFDMPGIVADFAEFRIPGQYRLIQRSHTRVIDKCTGAVVASQLWSVRTAFFVMSIRSLGFCSSTVSTQ